MRNIVRRALPAPALVIACLALFMAMGGAGYAALKGKDKKKVRAIADQEITKQSKGLSVANAEKLGGVPASGYQRSCTGGAIKATIVVNTTGLGPDFTNVPGFNCFQPGNLSSSVQIKRIGLGSYVVRFVGNSGPNASGSAVVSSIDDGIVNYDVANNDPAAPGEIEFIVVTRNDSGTAVDNHTFSLLAF